MTDVPSQTQVQLAVRAGARVVGSAGTKDGMDAVRAAGAHDTHNHREDGYLDAAVSEGEFDLVLEMAADVNLVSDLSVLASNGGRIAIVGSSRLRNRTQSTTYDAQRVEHNWSVSW